MSDCWFDVACGSRFPGDRAVVVELVAAETALFVVNATAPGPYRLVASEIVGACGNGLQDGEECEDGNTMSGDGCSAACTFEATASEVEPNEDGDPTTGYDFGPDVNDFDATAVTHALDNGAVVYDAAIRGGLSSGDEDVFALRNPSAAPANVSLRTITFLNPCILVDGTNDTVISVFSAAGTLLDRADDIQGSVDSCSFLSSFTIGAGQTVYVDVSVYGDVRTIDRYLLLVDFL